MKRKNFLGLSIDYWCEKENEDSDVTSEDAEYIYTALEKAVHERGMKIGGGMRLERGQDEDRRF